MKHIFSLLLPILLMQGAYAQLQPATLVIGLNVHKVWVAQNNYLVTHNEIRQKVAEGYFTALNLAAIPQDNACITSANAKLWLSIDETKLPANGRLPVWQELVPKAVAPVCNGFDQKVINGVCETAKKTLWNSELIIKNGKSYCKLTYRYKFSDGSYFELFEYGDGCE
ncbi:hypothetical protein [Chitinophaga qingshengii]|uniref:Uncharacterized protein n=1 Tax=Chitinophaga qingshengii TaxID=1569794 RepID=A0ABR7TGF5_9BACT|nr:hypothetical protein [Chitinophaga qingshengii]MBC9929527.1 hypothetical protein [Chitinophaga qingshengii]